MLPILFFDQKLYFYQYIDFYANKAISTVKCLVIQQEG